MYVTGDRAAGEEEDISCPHAMHGGQGGQIRRINAVVKMKEGRGNKERG